MAKRAKAIPVAAAILVACLVATTAYALTSAVGPQANSTSLHRHALPATEPSLVMNSNELTGENWMSGISGAFFLHEINIPGAHDACMWNVFTTGNIAKTQKSYAKTQALSIEDQLKAGVRFFDIRLTNKGPYLEDGPFAVHGPHKGWLGDYRFFNNAGKGSLSFETLLTWYAKFLREHPTETVILDVQYESESGDEGKTLAGARQKLDKYYTETNPSTGKPYIYTENGSKAVTTMPQLSDCRGQMVVMSCDNLQYGMKYGSSTGWTPKTIGGVHFAVENHFEAERDLKWKYVEKMLFGGTAVGNETFNDPLAGGTKGASLKLNRSAAGAPLDHGVVASTASNRPPIVTSSPHQDPKEIADYVNPRVYGASGCLANTGTFCGWIMSDFATNDTVKTYWKTNFPSDMQYMTVTYEAPDYTGGLRTTRNVLAGSEITLPSDPFPDSTAKRDFNNNYSFLGWTINGVDYKPGDTVKITDHTRITARVAMNWASFQYRMDAQDNGATFKMDCDVVGSPADIPLHISAGKTLTINMNGHTIDRASKAYGYSRAFTVDGNLTLTGTGTVKGGYDKNGAGFLVNGTLTMNDGITITGNRAGRWGGGVYIGSNGTFTMNGGSITGNIAEQGGGVFISQGSSGKPATFAMTGGAISGNNAKVGGGVSMLYENGAFNVKGNVNITGNYLIPNDREININTELSTSGDAQNVRLDTRNLITVNDALDPGSRIGITKVSSTGGGPLRIAYKSDGISTIVDNQNFTSDQANRQIIKYEDYYAAISDGVTVSFDTDGGSAAPESQTVGIGGRATKPADPTKSKYTFEYWYKSDDANQAEFDFSTAIGENTTLKAKWKPVKQTVTFNSNGGSAVEPQQVDYGSRATTPTVPVKEGATFVEWMVKVPLYGYKGQWTYQAYDFGRPVRNDIELVARWDTDKHTVTFDTAGGSDVTQQTVRYGANAKRPDDPTKANCIFTGWYTDEARTKPYGFGTPVKTDITLYAKWAPEQRYSVTFVTNGGSAVDAQSVVSGESAVEPTAPTRSDCNFAGWFTSSAFAGTSYDFSTPVTGNLVLYAQWSVSVTFDKGDGSQPSRQMVTAGAQVAQPSDPVRDGYAFNGWYASDKPYDFDAAVDAPLTLTARWVEKPAAPNTCVVVFDSNGGSAVDAVSIGKGEKVTAPTHAPTRTGYTFAGWYKDPGFSTQYDFDDPVTDDLFLFAKWEVASHNVTFNAGDGASSPISVPHGQTIAAPEEPTKAGNLFAGWYKNSECTVPFNFSNPVVADLTLYAKWVPMRHNVAFVTNDGSDVPTQSIASGGKAVAPNIVPLKEGCTLAGWYTDDDLSDEHQYDFDTPVNGDVTLFAKWTAHITFEPGNETSIAPQDITCGQKALKPSDPTKEGSNFEGWFVKSNATYRAQDIAALKNAVATDPSIASYYWITDNDEVRIAYDFDAPVEYGITLYARWAPVTHTITFDTAGGDPVESISNIDPGKKATAPTAPTKTGFIFGGWFLDAACEYPFDFSEAIVDDLTLHAKWTTRNYTVQFDTNCSESVPNQTVAHEGTVNEPDPIKNEGFDFGGWYKDPELSQPYDFSTPVTADMVLYARWSAQQPASTYTVRFVDEDSPEEEPAVPQTVNAGSTAQCPKPDPINEYATFVGWYVELEGELSDADIAEIENDPELASTVWVVDKNARVPYDFSDPVEEDITLYAHWDYGDCQVTYVDEGSELYIDVVKTGDTAKNLEPEEIYGYTFNGWFADEALTQPYDFSTPVTEDLTLHAKWTQNLYTVTFDSNGGSEVASQSVAFEELARVPEDPVREGHTFMGWYYDLGEKISDEELAELEAAEAEYETEFTDLLWLRDDTTLIEYDLANKPVYDDLNLQARWYNGTFTCEVDIQDGAPQVEVANLKEAARSALTEEDLAQGARVVFVVRPLTDQEASSDNARALDNLTAELEAADGVKFDISVYKYVGDSQQGIAVHELPVAAQLSIDVPDALQADGRTYYLLRSHDGEAGVLSVSAQTPVTGASDRFSPYEIAAKDKAADESGATGTKASSSKTSAAKTGDDNLGVIVIVVLVAVVALVVGVLAAKRMRGRNR